MPMQQMSSESLTSPACHCGHHLSFKFMSLTIDGQESTSVMCYCSRCDERSLRDGEAVSAQGYGRDQAEAYARRERALECF